MKISYNWLKQYLEELPGPEETSLILTACGLEVEMIEKFQSVAGGLEGILIGEVLECLKHPNADKLSLTKVSVGEKENLSIVCGAPNVAAGQKVLVARVGTKLHTPKGEFVLEKTKIRGEFSEGMICAEDELGLGTSHEGIMVLEAGAPVGMQAKEYFRVEEDFVFEIGLTPNRSDATSHIGVARDLLAVLNLRRMQKGLTPHQLKIPDVDAFCADDNVLDIPVIIEDEQACPRYSGVTVTGISVSESPEWLKNKLKAIDVRPINIIVDITQYVLFETGQPLHAFDADEIAGGKVIVKKLPAGTEFKTLDGQTRKLTGEDLMICNADEGMCMAGVFGGEKSGVQEKTKNIFIESACFNPATIRKTSRHHGLKTDASFRFERGSDINITLFALKRAALLIRELAGGRISSPIVDVCPGVTESKKIFMSFGGLDAIAGQHIEPEVVRNIMQSLEFRFENETPEGLQLAVPSAKVDVTRDVDVYEEVLRIYGYDNIRLPDLLRTSINFNIGVEREMRRNAIGDYLSANGFFEIMTNSLTNSGYSEKYKEVFNPENDVKLQNPVSRELNVMRQTLLFGGIESIIHNQNRKNPDLKLYEFGNVYQYIPCGDGMALSAYLESMQLALFITGSRAPENWHDKTQKANLFLLKSYVENIFQKMGIGRRSLTLSTDGLSYLDDQLHYSHGGKRLGFIGTLSKKMLGDFDLRDEIHAGIFNWDKLLACAEGNEIAYREIPKFPEVRRDLALLIDKTIRWSEIEHLAFETEKTLLKKVNLFDVYVDEKMQEKKSYAVSFILQDETRTLTEKGIEDIMKRLTAAFAKKLGATLR